jgi:hypothetical protein
MTEALLGGLDIAALVEQSAAYARSHGRF